jgi:hypothetical protein
MSVTNPRVRPWVDGHLKIFCKLSEVPQEILTLMGRPDSIADLSGGCYRWQWDCKTRSEYERLWSALDSVRAQGYLTPGTVDISGLAPQEMALEWRVTALEEFLFSNPDAPGPSSYPDRISTLMDRMERLSCYESTAAALPQPETFPTASIQPKKDRPGAPE